MNVGNILKVADAIEQASVPGLGFNMSNWFGFKPDRSGRVCGTTACLAGWACRIIDGFIPASDNARLNTPAFKRAREIFALSHNEADHLFAPFCDAMFGANSAQGVRVLRNLAITGKVDWAAAMKDDEPTLPALPVAVPVRESV